MAVKKKGKGATSAVRVGGTSRARTSGGRGQGGFLGKTTSSGSMGRSGLPGLPSARSAADAFGRGQAAFASFGAGAGLLEVRTNNAGGAAGGSPGAGGGTPPGQGGTPPGRGGGSMTSQTNNPGPAGTPPGSLITMPTRPVGGSFIPPGADKPMTPPVAAPPVTAPKPPVVVTAPKTTTVAPKPPVAPPAPVATAASAAAARAAAGNLGGPTRQMAPPAPAPVVTTRPRTVRAI